MQLLDSKEDRDLSPYTGWTRQHWDELFCLMMHGVVKHVQVEQAAIAFPGRPSTSAALQLKSLSASVRGSVPDSTMALRASVRADTLPTP